MLGHGVIDHREEVAHSLFAGGARIAILPLINIDDRVRHVGIADLLILNNAKLKFVANFLWVNTVHNHFDYFIGIFPNQVVAFFLKNNFDNITEY